MRERYCKQCGGWHSLNEPWPVECVSPARRHRSSLPAPMLIRDEMPPTQSMLDGKYYTSKRELRRTYKDAGVVEVGNEIGHLKPKPKPKPDRGAIRTSVRKAMSQAGLGS